MVKFPLLDPLVGDSLRSTLMAFFLAPTYRKKSLSVLKESNEFIHYKKDLLSSEQIASLQSTQQELRKALKAKEAKLCFGLIKKLQKQLSQTLVAYQPLKGLDENLFSLFVSLIVVFSIRAYFVQPFRIPTGSMQPSLWGIHGKSLAAKEWPSLKTRALQKITRGRSYFSITSPQADKIIKIQEKTRFLILFGSEITFASGRTQRIPIGLGSLLNEFGFRKTIQSRAKKSPIPKGKSIIFPGGIFVHAGETLLSGFADSGDLIVVNKVSYHFRKPTRGEVFVFKTFGMQKIAQNFGSQGAGSHYIKRLGGVPGDEVQIQQSKLYINGKVAAEPGFVKVMERKGLYAKSLGYSGASANSRFQGEAFLPAAKPETKRLLNALGKPQFFEYIALGDNTKNSFDSRYWGTIPQQNLMGPAILSLWPFKSGHWGKIR